MATRSEWVSWGRDAVIELLTEQLAAPVAEIEARISDRPWRDLNRTIDPHLLGQARRDLEAAGLIDRVEARTRGGRMAAVLQPSPIPPRKRRATQDAAARKRLLLARWRSWSRGTTDMPNLIGAGGEAVVHRSLLNAAPFGYRVVQPTRGEVATLYGEPVPGGPLDNAAWLTPMDQETQTPTGQTYLIPIEVKNVRHWLYPNHWEIYQLLHKAAGLANAHPEHPVLPILICRKAHYRTRQLAKDLGFLVFQTHDQYILPNERVRTDHFDEVRRDLGLQDLRMTEDASPALVQWLSGAPHREAKAYSERWLTFTRHQIRRFVELRRPELSLTGRLTQLEELHQEVEQHFDEAGSWSGSEHHYSE